MKDSAAVAIIGAGPLGIEMAIALKLARIPYLHFDKAQAVQMIYNFPPGTHFFSSSERIGIAGIPVQTLDQQKCSREQYLAYIRSVILKYKLHINTFEEIRDIGKNQDFILHTGQTKSYRVPYLIIATGSTSFPRRLNIPGEDLEHVSVKMLDPHKYFQKRVLIIGGKNSAVEAALRCYQVNAAVSIALKREQFSPKEIKYWLLPELMGRIERKEIACFYQAQSLEIFKDRVLLQSGEKKFEVPADFVIKAIGFDADMSLFRMVGAELSKEDEAPLFNTETMETTVPNVYALGTAIAGTQKKYRVFIENTHEHVGKILLSLSNKLGITLKPDSWVDIPTSHPLKLEE